jgi:hypothetical protein
MSIKLVFESSLSCAYVAEKRARAASGDRNLQAKLSVQRALLISTCWSSNTTSWLLSTLFDTTREQEEATLATLLPAAARLGTQQNYI